MKRSVFLLCIFLFIPYLFGCSSSNQSFGTTENSKGTYEKKYMIDAQMTLTFSFGNRQGVYTGTVKNELPHGYGSFSTFNDENVAWTYFGEWEDGHFSGYGITDFPDQAHMGYYINDSLNGDGVAFFDDGSMECGEFENGNLIQPYIDASSLLNDKSDATIPPAEISSQYSPGTYKIGDVIPAGYYCLINGKTTGFAKAEINIDSNHKFESIGLLIDTSTFYYFQVFDGEYLTIEDGYVIPWDGLTTTALSAYDNIESGMYFVGTDIPAGEYKITNVSDSRKAHFQIFSEVPSSNEDIYVSSGYVEVNDFVTLNNGECIIVRNGTMELID